MAPPSPQNQSSGEQTVNRLNRKASHSREPDDVRISRTYLTPRNLTPKSHANSPKRHQTMDLGFSDFVQELNCTALRNASLDSTSFKQTKATDSKSQSRKRSSSDHSNSVKLLTKQPTPYFGPPDRASKISVIDQKEDAGSKRDLDDVMMDILADPEFDSTGFQEVLADL